MSLDFVVDTSKYCSHECCTTALLLHAVENWICLKEYLMNDSVLRIIFGQMCAAFFFSFTLFMREHVSFCSLRLCNHLSLSLLNYMWTWIMRWLMFTNDRQTYS